MEPFWNMVKIKQVIGRARRNNSHINLPLSQRNVRVYEYIGIFSKEQVSGKWSKNMDKTLEGLYSTSSDAEDQRQLLSEEDLQYDDGKTSDQSLLEISEIKA